MASNTRSRSTSISTTDSQLPRINLLSPPAVTPNPAFIATSAASQIITTDQEFNAADFVAEEDYGTTASALVTSRALAALNGFLDHLLYNILATAKSTQLAHIRPAVADVLKPRLAREVVCAADEELSEYMGGTEDEHFELRQSQDLSGDFDLIRCWKLTRLRCMVYTRLGDMEEDDEDEYIAQDGLGESEDGPRRFASHVGNITPAAAIFLTSIIEYIGEQALVIAGETARSRLTAKMARDHDEITESGVERSSLNRLVVEDLDMERLAMNATLGRLWRTWRKRVRAQTLGRAVSRESFRRPGSAPPIPASSRKSSIITVDEAPARSISSPVAEEEVDPAEIPLPMTDFDIQEIEYPALTPPDSEEEVQTHRAVLAQRVRPRSMMVFPARSNSVFHSNSPVISSNPPSPKLARRVRSRSLPSASYFPGPPWEVKPAVEEQDAPHANEETVSAPSDDGKEVEHTHEHDEKINPFDGRTGLAISTDQGFDEPEGEVSKDTGIQTPPEAEEPSAVQDADAVSQSEDVGSPASSVYSTSPSAGDAQEKDGVQRPDPEVIEGRGLCERPKSVILRPKRMSSREPAARKEERSPSAMSEPVMRTVDEDQHSKQGGDTIQPVTSNDASDTSYSTATSGAAQTELSNDETACEQPPQETANSSETAHPPSTSTSSASDEQQHPASSRSRRKPSPLILQTENVQNTHGRSSPSTSSGVERAGVQRVKRTSTSLTSSSTYSKPRRSDSFSSAREFRPVTSASAHSQVSTKLKGLIGRQPGDTSSARVRSSSDTSRNSVSGDSDNLEKLIKSNQTLHFTLTPKNMREMEVRAPYYPLKHADVPGTGFSAMANGLPYRYC